MGGADVWVLAEPWTQDGEGPGAPAVLEQKACAFTHHLSICPPVHLALQVSSLSGRRRGKGVGSVISLGLGLPAVFGGLRFNPPQSGDLLMPGPPTMPPFPHPAPSPIPSLLHSQSFPEGFGPLWEAWGRGFPGELSFSPELPALLPESFAPLSNWREESHSCALARCA